MSTAPPKRPSAPRRGAPPARPAARPAAASIDPFRVLRRHMLLLIASVFVGGAIGTGSFFALRKYYPLFKGFVQFEVQPGVAEAGDVTTTTQMKEEDVARIGNTQLVLLTSRDVLRSAVGRAEVQGTRWFQTNYASADGLSENIEEAVDDLENQLTVGVVRGTQLFQIEWATHNREDVPLVLNAIAEAYMERRSEIDESVFDNNLEIAQDELDKTNRKIADLDQEIEDHIIAAGIQSLDDPRYSAVALAMDSLTQQLNELTLQRSFAETSVQLDQAKIDGQVDFSPEDMREGQSDPSVQLTMRTVEALKIDARVLRESHPEGHPLVNDIDRRLRAAEDVLKEKTTEVIRRNLNARIKIAADTLKRTSNSIDQLETELESKGAELQELASQQSKYDSMVDRREFLEKSRENDQEILKEISILRLRDDAKIARVLTFAERPRDIYFPKLVIIVPLGVLLITGLTTGIVFLQELTYSKIKSASDLSVVPGARLLGVLPDLDDDPTKCKSADLVVVNSPSSVLAEAYRQASAMLQKSLDRAGHQTLLVTSGLPGSGTSTVVTNVAASLASSGRRICIVDANFRRPSLAKQMGLPDDSAGFADLLHGEGDVESVVHAVDHGFDVIAAGTPARRIPERLTSGHLNALLAELRAQYDHIIFDAAPAVVAGDSVILANRIDAIALVVRADAEERGLIARLIQQFESSECDVLGVLLNRPRGSAGGYFKKNFATMASYAKGA